MSVVHVSRASKFEMSHSRWRIQAVQALISAILMLVLAGCSSAVTKLETWEGSPETAGNAAILSAPGVIHVSQVNGRSMTNYLMDDLALDYALLPGENEVVFTYKTIWAKSGVVRNGESKVHVIESEPQVLHFEAAPNETYRFEFDRPESRRQAEEMLPEFSAAVVGASGQVLARSSSWSPDDSSLVARTPASGESGGLASDAEVLPGSDESSLNQLKELWENASEEDRKAFLRWAFE